MNCATTTSGALKSGRVSVIDGDHRMQDRNADLQDVPAAVLRCASLRVDRIHRQPVTAASSPGPHSESDLDAAAAVVGSTLLGGAFWFALALWLT
jgi:hypothetical protein